MFPFRRNKDRSTQPAQPWMHWLVLLILGYAIISNYGKESDVGHSIQAALKKNCIQKNYSKPTHFHPLYFLKI